MTPTVAELEPNQAVVKVLICDVCGWMAEKRELKSEQMRRAFAEEPFEFWEWPLRWHKRDTGHVGFHEDWMMKERGEFGENRWLIQAIDNQGHEKTLRVLESRVNQTKWLDECYGCTDLSRELEDVVWKFFFRRNT